MANIAETLPLRATHPEILMLMMCMVESFVVSVKRKYTSLPIIRRWDASAKLDIHRREVSDEIRKMLSNLR